jgi:hypothetical protein
VRPAIDLGDEGRFAVVRTHYGDDGLWRALLRALDEEYGRYGRPSPDFLLVDDPAWADATPEEVVAAVSGPAANAVFLADAEALTEEKGWPLLTVDVPVPGWEPRPVEETRFRSALDMVYYVDCNLSIANLDFADFADGAGEAPDGVLRFATYYGPDAPQYPDPEQPAFTFTPRPLELP